jgi:cytochrome c553
MNKLTSIFLSAGLVLLAAAGQAQDIKGDAQAGEKKNAMCIGCHGIVGYQASFPEVYKAPKISGQNAKYIASALSAYKKGERKHPTMRAIADSLTEQDMADLAAYYSSNGLDASKKPEDKASKEASPKVTALLNKAACVSCHGANFSKPIDPAYPKLAGQHADYLFVALKSYKTEGNATWGRSNGVMAGMAKQFTHAELKELSQYIASLDGELKTVPQKKFR